MGDQSIVLATPERWVSATRIRLRLHAIASVSAPSRGLTMTRGAPAQDATPTAGNPQSNTRRLDDDVFAQTRMDMLPALFADDQIANSAGAPYVGKAGQQSGARTSEVSPAHRVANDRLATGGPPL